MGLCYESIIFRHVIQSSRTFIQTGLFRIAWLILIVSTQVCLLISMNSVYFWQMVLRFNFRQRLLMRCSFGRGTYCVALWNTFSRSVYSNSIFCSCSKDRALQVFTPNPCSVVSRFHSTVALCCHYWSMFEFQHIQYAYTFGKYLIWVYKLSLSTVAVSYCERFHKNVPGVLKLTKIHLNFTFD